MALESDVGASITAALAFYREKCVVAHEAQDLVIDWKALHKGACLGVSHLDFWAAVIRQDERMQGKDEKIRLKRCSDALPVAAMLLAIPAGESVDEFSFSSSQRTLSKERNSLLPVNVEQITVIRMFIRSFGLSPMQLDDWMRDHLPSAASVSKKPKVTEGQVQKRLSFSSPAAPL